MTGKLCSKRAAAARRHSVGSRVAAVAGERKEEWNELRQFRGGVMSSLRESIRIENSIRC